MTDTVEVIEDGRVLAFALDDVMRFHGGRSPGGAALGFKVLQRVLPLLTPGGRPERRTVAIDTAFGGPGARDAIELVTRAVSDHRYRVDGGLARPELGFTRERFVFTFAGGDGRVTATLREGFVTDEFATLAFAGELTSEQDARLEVLKRELAERVATQPAERVFDVTNH